MFSRDKELPPGGIALLRGLSPIYRDRTYGRVAKNTFHKGGTDREENAELPLRGRHETIARATGHLHVARTQTSRDTVTVVRYGSARARTGRSYSGLRADRSRAVHHPTRRERA